VAVTARLASKAPTGKRSPATYSIGPVVSATPRRPLTLPRRTYSKACTGPLEGSSTTSFGAKYSCDAAARNSSTCSGFIAENGMCCASSARR